MIYERDEEEKIETLCWVKIFSYNVRVGVSEIRRVAGVIKLNEIK